MDMDLPPRTRDPPDANQRFVAGVGEKIARTGAWTPPCDPTGGLFLMGTLSKAVWWF